MEDPLGRRDPVMRTYPFMDSPRSTVMLSLLYLIFVLYAGPQWMKNRKPFVLKTPMIIYNMLLVVISTWMVYTSFKQGLSNYSLRCQPIDYSYSDSSLKVIQVSWVYFFTKLVEFFDTIFFVLRKKDKQINFLHVFHHSTLPIATWYGATYGPGGYNIIFPTVNAFVHIWMYLYYGLAALGPGVQKYLWWKKYITKLQLTQFVIGMVYFTQLLLFPKEGCNVNQFLIWLSFLQAILYMGLFLHFYFKEYTKKNIKSNGTNGHSHRE